MVQTQVERNDEIYRRRREMKEELSSLGGFEVDQEFYSGITEAAARRMQERTAAGWITFDNASIE